MLRAIYIALRTFGRRPGSTALVVLLLALGIGADLLVFSLVQAMLLRPLEFPRSDNLVRVYATQDLAGSNRLRATAGEFFGWRRESRSFESLVAAANFGLSITESPEPLNPRMRQVSSGYFPTFGVAPILGRDFSDQDHRLLERVVILEYRFWQSYYGGDPEVIGRTLELAGEPHEVIGVMPAWWDQPAFPQQPPVLWAPMSETAEMDRQSGLFVVIGRLAEGVPVSAATGEMKSLQRQLAIANASDEGRSVRVIPLRDSLVESIQPALWALFGAITFMLLIVLSNVAHLLLARAISRRQEMGIRVALGANGGHLVRQLLTEGLLLGGAAGGLGLVLAAVTLPVVLAMAPINTSVPLLDSVRLDGGVMAYALIVTLLTGLLCSLLPLWHARRASADVVRPDGRGGGTRHKKRWQGALIVAEVGLSLALLVGAGLMVRSFVHLRGLDLGFEPDNLLTLRAAPRGPGLDTPEQQAAFYQQALDQLRTIPGVESATVCELLPTFASFRPSLPLLDVDQPPSTGTGPRAVLLRAEAGYFATVETPIVAGREFLDSDRAGAENVVVLGRSVVHSLWGKVADEAAVGRRVRFGDDGVPMRVVGVAADLRGIARAPEAPPVIYQPMAQNPVVPATFFLRVRPEAAAEAKAIFAASENVIWGFSSRIPVYLQARLADIVRDIEWQPRFVMQLLGIFAALALILTAVGIYAIVTFAIAERTREIGVRVALGANHRQILTWILGDAGRMTAAGIGLGLVLSAFGVQLLEAQLQGVQPFDALTWVGLASCMAAIGLFAAWLPARRALKVDPSTALRAD